MKQLKIFFSTSAFSMLVLASAASPVRAATAIGVNASLYFVTPTSSVTVGQTFSVTVMLGTDQPVNAYSISLRYDGSALRLNDASNANSIIEVAPSGPNVSGNMVSYIGGSFTPFIGNAGTLLTLDFTAIATGTDELVWNPSNIYLANGKGTRVSPRLVVSSVRVTAAPSGNGSGGGGSTAADITPPTINSLSFVADPFDLNQKLLSFLVADAGSGVAETDIRARDGFFWSGWTRVENPAPLGNGVWEADLRVTDNAGNIAEATIYDQSAFVRFVTLWGGLLMAFIAIIAILLRRRMLKYKT